MPGFGFGFSENTHNGTVLNQTPLAPSALVLTALSDTSIKLDFTVNATGQDGHKIERSTDNITFAEIATVSGTTATYTNTGLTEYNKFYYRVRAYKSASNSDYCTVANDYTAKKLTLTANGTGAEVGAIRLFFTITDVNVTLDGNGKFYSDSGGTADESTSFTFVAGALRTRYIKVSSGISNLLIFAKGNFTQIGDTSNSGWTAIINAPILGGSITNAANLSLINIDSTYTTLSGNISNKIYLTYLYIKGSNTLTGSITNLVNLKTLVVQGLNTLSGSVTNLKALEIVNVTNSNTIAGDLGGTGTAATVYGITTLILNPCGMIDYTAGATWSNATVTINPSVGYGIPSAKIDSMLIDMNASNFTSRVITLQGSNGARTAASNSAVTALQGRGCTVITN